MTVPNKTIEEGGLKGTEPEYLSKLEVARLLGVSYRTIENMMARGDITYVKLTTKLVRFPRRAVLENIERNLTVRARHCAATVS